MAVRCGYNVLVMNAPRNRLGLRTFCVVAGITGVLALADVATSMALPLVPVPVQLTTYIGAPPAGVRPEFSWRVTYNGRPYTLSIVNLRVFSSQLMPLDIDAAVALYKVKFRIGGEKAALRQFVGVATGQLVTIEAFVQLDPNARYLLLDDVEPATDAAVK